MTLSNSFTFSLILVTCAGVKGREFIGSPNIKHWLRALSPPNDCDGAKAGTKIKDTDCHNFNICTGEGTNFVGPYSCLDLPDSEFLCFDPAAADGIGDCSAVEATCTKLCDDTEPLCATECTQQLDLIPDPTVCRKYYICKGASNDDAIEQYCFDDEKPYFNGKKCVADQSQCCTCNVGTCKSEGEKIADPNDCHAFYYCVTVGSNLIPIGPHKCDDGGSFVDGDCQATTTTCENICDLGGDVTSTSATNTTSSGSPTMTTATDSASSTVTATTITATTTTTGCMDLSDFTCPGNGFYARCTYCDPSYFKCNGNDPKIGKCAESLVFNPDPAFPYCIRPENCPFHPSQPFNP